MNRVFVLDVAGEGAAEAAYPGPCRHRCDRVSANAEVDERSGATSFTATIEVGADQFKGLPHVKLYPGMPVDVSIVTGERKGIVRATTLAAGLTSVGIV
ncbi:hypothetical protein D3227_38490 [Mesorhizobium waimense]|uniref:AprE-like beta-barrel domain-containing protein n=1 Tax=Mesorhizobium waimense TaxID=1300307 RepID=A0A3A5JRY3_9HYPH|nr:hypothetical protein D3227_38490 [Mesorhizobium waimense]